MPRDSIARSLLATALALAALVVVSAPVSAEEATPDPAQQAATEAAEAAARAPSQPSAPDGLVVTEYVVRRSSSFTPTIVVDGIIENQSAVALGVRTIAVSLIDRDGNTVGAGGALFKPTTLEAGQSSGWTVSMPNTVVKDLTSITARIQLEAGSAEQRFLEPISHDLRIEGMTFQAARPGGFPAIQGQVVNTGTVAVDQPRLILAIYDQDGKLVGVDAGHATLTTVGPAQSSPFSQSVIGLQLDKKSTVKIYAEARVRR